jgi:hypothetical protein
MITIDNIFIFKYISNIIYNRTAIRSVCKNHKGPLKGAPSRMAGTIQANKAEITVKKIHGIKILSIFFRKNSLLFAGVLYVMPAKAKNKGMWKTSMAKCKGKRLCPMITKRIPIPLAKSI